MSAVDAVWRLWEAWRPSFSVGCSGRRKGGRSSKIWGTETFGRTPSACSHPLPEVTAEAVQFLDQQPILTRKESFNLHFKTMFPHKGRVGKFYLHSTFLATRLMKLRAPTRLGLRGTLLGLLGSITRNVFLKLRWVFRLSPSPSSTSYAPFRCCSVSSVMWTRLVVPAFTNRSSNVSRIDLSLKNIAFSFKLTNILHGFIQFSCQIRITFLTQEGLRTPFDWLR